MTEVPSIVVVGGSAGAVEALFELLPALSPSCPAPVVVVVHLPTRSESLLASLLAAKCAVPVLEASDKERLRPAHVYFAPPDYHLLVEAEGMLSLDVDEPVHFSRPSIDVLFESAALAYGADVLAIVLTGANRDGAAGAAAVRREGGAVIVQDPAGALAPTMPAAAIEASHPQRILDLPAIARVLSSLSERKSSP